MNIFATAINNLGNPSIFRRHYHKLRLFPKYSTNIVSNDNEHVYTDGSVQPKKQYTGIGLFYNDLSPKNLSCRISGLSDTNRTELAAIYAAISSSNFNRDLVIFTDSQCSIDMINNFYNKNKGVKTKYKILLDEISQLIDDRYENTILSKVKGHSNIYGNIRADYLAKNAPENIYFLLPDITFTELLTHYKNRDKLIIPTSFF
jgi:ribonuclease HI